MAERVDQSLETLGKAARNTSIAALAILGAGALIENYVFHTETESSGTGSLENISTAYDLTIYDNFPELTFGYTNDEHGWYNPDHSWANIEGIAIKDAIYRPPYAIQREVREDELGKYIYVFMEDEQGNEVPFRFDEMAIDVISIQDCPNENDGSPEISFPECPDPTDPEFRGAISTKAFDGAVTENGKVVRDANVSSDKITFGRYCLAKLLASNIPLDSRHGRGLADAIAAEVPNGALAYDRWQDMTFATLRTQITDSYGISVFDKYGLPTVRFQHEQLAIQEIMDRYGKEIFSNSVELQKIMFGYEQFDDTLALQNGQVNHFNFGPSYGAQVMEQKKINDTIKLGDLINREEPDKSLLNVYSCLFVIGSEEKRREFRTELETSKYIAGNYGEPLVLPDGTKMTAAELDRRLSLIANEPPIIEVGVAPNA